MRRPRASARQTMSPVPPRTRSGRAAALAVLLRMLASSHPPAGIIERKSLRGQRSDLLDALYLLGKCAFSKNVNTFTCRCLFFNLLPSGLTRRQGGLLLCGA